MSNLVIVAIPDKQDNVWKVSSEKVPHLTLLFLGENTEDVPKLGRIVDFVEHAVTVEQRGPCMLDVDERGTLGADEADVLFFRKDYSIKWLEHFRNQLLQQTDIRSAYESADQFPEWQPHLTLGYPATPANDDEIPEHGLGWVSFDRIAVWTGDFEGPEFKLRWPERELCEVAYGDVGKDAVAAVLEHHGVKGQKWGIRKQHPDAEIVRRLMGPSTKPNRPTVIKGSDKRFARRAKSADTYLALHDRTVKANKAARKAIDNKPEYKDAKFGLRGKDRNTPLHQKYIDEHYALYAKTFNEQANKVVNEAGTKQYAFRDVPNASKFSIKREIYVKDVKHASNDPVDSMIVELLLDADGKVTGYKMSEPETVLQQTVALGEEFLSHHGIKGMHWGIRNRKGEPVAVAPTASSKVPHGDRRKTKIEVEGGQNHPAHEDAVKVAEAQAKLKKSGPAALSNNELRDVANRLQLENQVAVLTSHKGKQFVTRQLQVEGQNLTRAGVREGVKRGVKKAGFAVAAG